MQQLRSTTHVCRLVKQYQPQRQVCSNCLCMMAFLLKLSVCISTTPRKILQQCMWHTKRYLQQPSTTASQTHWRMVSKNCLCLMCSQATIMYWHKPTAQPTRAWMSSCWATRLQTMGLIWQYLPMRYSLVQPHSASRKVAMVAGSRPMYVAHYSTQSWTSACCVTSTIFLPNQSRSTTRHPHVPSSTFKMLQLVRMMWFLSFPMAHRQHCLMVSMCYLVHLLVWA